MGPAFAEDKPAELCRTNKCHAEMLAYRFSHDPLPDCSTCHELKNKEKHKFALLNEGSDLCMTCHAGVLDGKPLRHSAVDNCTTCHHLHGAKDNPYIRKPVAELCVDCHEDMKPAFAKAKSSHLPAKWNCLVCHDVHGSKEDKYVKAPIAELCGSCHPGPRSVKHPTSTDSCITCHSPHYADFEMLLKKAPGTPTPAAPKKVSGGAP